MQRTGDPSNFVRAPRDELSKSISSLDREITSKQHERLARAFACLVMVMIGAVMAMRLRLAMPLTVYLWSFFPALAATIGISMGQQMTHQQGIVGLPALWAGPVLLSILALVEYTRLRRH